MAQVILEDLVSALDKLHPIPERFVQRLVPLLRASDGPLSYKQLQHAIAVGKLLARRPLDPELRSLRKSFIDFCFHFFDQPRLRVSPRQRGDARGNIQQLVEMVFSITQTEASDGHFVRRCVDIAASHISHLEKENDALTSDVVLGILHAIRTHAHEVDSTVVARMAKHDGLLLQLVSWVTRQDMDLTTTAHIICAGMDTIKALFSPDNPLPQESSQTTLEEAVRACYELQLKTIKPKGPKRSTASDASPEHIRIMCATMAAFASVCPSRQQADDLTDDLSDMLFAPFGEPHDLLLAEAAAEALGRLVQTFSATRETVSEHIRRALVEPCPVFSVKASKHVRLIGRVRTSLGRALARAAEAGKDQSRSRLVPDPFVEGLISSLSSANAQGNQAAINRVYALAKLPQWVSDMPTNASERIIIVLFQSLNTGDANIAEEITAHLVDLGSMGPQHFRMIMDFLLQLPWSSSKTDQSSEDQGAKQALIANAICRLVTASDELCLEVGQLNNLLNRFLQPALAAIAVDMQAAYRASVQLRPFLSVIAAALGHTCWTEETPKQTLEYLRTFWYFALLVGYWSFKSNPSEEDEVDRDMATIARFTPPLLYQEAKQYLQSELETSTAPFQNAQKQRYLSMLHSQLAAAIDSPSLQTEVNRLGLAESLYLLSIFAVENNRLMQKGALFFPTFRYLEDAGIHIQPWYSVCRGVIASLFRRYTERLAEQRSGRERQALLEDLTVFLLTKFNHTKRQVKEAADLFLSHVTETFPSLLWSGKVLVAMLNLLEALRRTVDVTKPISVAINIELPHPPFVLTTPATYEQRVKILSDFSAMCKEILKQANTHAPSSAAANLQHYIALLKHEKTTGAHAGLSLAFSSLATSSDGKPSALMNVRSAVIPGVPASAGAAATAHLAGAPGSGAPTIMGTFGPSISLRAHYQGQLEGVLLSILANTNNAGHTSDEAGVSNAPFEGEDKQLSADTSTWTAADRQSEAADSRLIAQSSTDSMSIKSQASQKLAFRRRVSSRMKRSHASTRSALTTKDQPAPEGQEEAEIKEDVADALSLASDADVFAHVPQSDMAKAIQQWSETVLRRVEAFMEALIQLRTDSADLQSGNTGDEDPTALVPTGLLPAVPTEHSSTSDPTEDDGTAPVGQHDLEALFEEAMYQACAILALRPPGHDPLSHVTPVMSARLVHAVVWAPVRVFTRQSMIIGTMCWEWVVAARPDAETRLLNTMESAWSWSVESRIGLFSAVEGHKQSSEAVFEHGREEPMAPDGRPHVVWIAYLQDRLDAVKDSSLSQMQMIAHMCAKALAMPQHLSPHPSVDRARYMLFNLAMNLLHAKTALRNTYQISLRNSVYNAIVLSFAHTSRWPGKFNLMHEIEALVALWHSLQADKRSCKIIDEQQKPKLSKKSANERFMRRRHLAMLLVRNEMERLCSWYNPSGQQVHRQVPGEDAVRKSTKPSPSPSERTWKEYISLAWSLSPQLAVGIAQRFGGQDAARREVQALVKRHPAAVSHVPEALEFLVTPQNVSQNIPELANVLHWAPVAPMTALHLLRTYPAHPAITQYAIRVLHSYSDDTILFYIPQLVQALRYDASGKIATYLVKTAKESQLLAHQLIWNMNTNMFMDDDGEVRDERIADKLEQLVNQIKGNLGGAALKFYEKEFEFFAEITAVSGNIREFELGPKRDEACLRELAKVEVKPGCYLPSNPDGFVLDIDYNSGKPMQSAAKAPYLARFKVKPCSLQDIEAFDEKTQSVETINDLDPRWQACIFKVGDDVRQDMLALQVIQLFKDIYQTIGLEVALFPYRVVATGPGSGVIECVPNAKSRDQLGRQTNISLYEYFLNVYGDEDTLEFQQARVNFIRSMAAYSVIGFLLQIKDRHNGNIMINTEGFIIHIDFGFMFESSPGGNIGFEPDLKLTYEMVQIMGGDQAAEPYRYFEDLCVRCYLAVRPYQEQIVALVELMLDSGLPCFRTPRVLDSLRSRFAAGKTEAEAAAFVRQRINHSYLNIRTGLYDKIQYMQNKIPY